MDNFKTLLISFSIICLFAYALLNFGYGLQNANDVNKTILDDPTLRSFNSSISANITELKGGANSQFNATLDEQGEEQQPAGDLTLGSIFHSITNYGTFILGVGGSILTLSGRVGLDGTIQGVLISMLVVLAVLLSWRLIKAG